MTFQELQTTELKKACEKHSSFPTLHHARAVIEEEVEEFWDEVKMQLPNNKYLLAELVQIAAMAERTALDLKLLESQ